MRKRSFPSISGLSCRSLRTGTLTMTTSQLKQNTKPHSDKFLPMPVELDVPDQSKPIDNLSDKVSCPYCNGYVSEIDTFCIHCGKQFLEQTASYCTRCGHGVDQDARVCPYCGVRLHL